MAIRVVLVDDVDDLRILFRTAFTRDPRFEVVGEAADGYEAIAQAKATQPDVIVLDIAMPKMNGLKAIPLLHEASPGSKILVLSGFDTARVAAKALELTASAFIEKGAPASSVVNLAEEVYNSPNKIER
ncbi:MAG: response regulator [Actinomycetota bacterium]